ncbi:hypothetical protein AB3X89_29830 [Paraburkholderia sp. BR14320]|uniref:hypothetical protein n=1 Tax=Paraburkholderia sp. BR14264 TaxID=3237001 RepID=UPI0034D0AC2E
MNLRLSRIPYYVQGVRAGLAALSLAERHRPMDGIEIRVDGVSEPVCSTFLVVYTETTSSMAAIYSRLLLEFLGLKVGGNPSQLQEINKRTRRGDIGIEDYRRADGTPLAKVLPSVVDHFPTVSVSSRRGSRHAILQASAWHT